MPEVNEDLTRTGGKFLDTAEGGEDFYAFWYSTVYTVGMINTYRDTIVRIRENEMMLRRFLISRGVYFSKISNLDTLQFLFDNWIKEIVYRGTERITRPRGYSEIIGVDNDEITGVITTDVANNSGMGVHGDKLIQLDNLINVGNIYSFEFDFIMTSIKGTQFQFSSNMFENMELFNGFLNISTTGIVVSDKVTLDLIYNKSNIEIILPSLDVPVNGKNHFKLVTIKDTTYVYLNEVLMSTTVHKGNSSNYSFDALSNGVIPAIANVKVVSYDLTLVPTNLYKWYCNEGSGCRISCSGTDKDFIIYALPTTEFDSVWIKDSRFENVSFNPIDGELRRLLSIDHDDLILELIDQTETGLTIDKSSFLSEEANMVNMNKAYEKGDVKSLAKYPLDFTTLYAKKDNGYITYMTVGANSNCGINTPLLANPDWKSNLSYKPLGLVPFIPIPVAVAGDDMDGYEVSFVLNINKACKITFGILGYDANLDYIPNSFRNYNEVVTNLFMSGVLMSKYLNTDVMVRGVFSIEKLLSIDTHMNLQELGVNLYTPYNSNPVKYIVPTLRIESLESTTVKVKDIIIRPLTINSIKGILGGRNQMFGYMKNRSGELTNNILSKIQDDLIPYNCSTNIKFI